MSTAGKILIMGGVLNLAYGFLTGVFMSRVRRREPSVSKYLSLAHMGPLMWCPILLAMVIAVNFANLPVALAVAAAVLLVSGSFLLDAKDTINWLQGVTDEFVEHPPGFVMGGVSGVAAAAGLLIVIVGDIRAL
jgi:hypothetical protein